MASKTEIPITGSVLAWSLDEAGLTPAELAVRLKVDPVTVDGWINETARPGKTEFAQIVDAVRRPSAIFYMPEPPRQANLPVSYRRAPGVNGHTTSPRARREVRKARRIQQVMSWLLADEGVDLVLPRFSLWQTTPLEAAAVLRAKVGLSLEDQAGWQNPSAALRQWRQILDDLGILTFSLQLGKDDVRGFSAWDDRAPIVAFNTAFNEGARIFTMGHELGHLLLRSESACYEWVGPDDGESTKLERWCEEFAAAFVLPPAELYEFVRKNYGVTESNPVDTFDLAIRIARKLKVSARALTVSLIDVGLARRSLYALVDKQARVVDRPRDSGGGGGGQPTPEKRLGQYGSRVSQTVSEAVATGALGVRDAADVLDVSIGDLQDISASVLGQAR